VPGNLDAGDEVDRQLVSADSRCQSSSPRAFDWLRGKNPARRELTAVGSDGHDGMNEQLPVTLYLVDRNRDGSIRLLIRFRRTAHGTWGEFLAGGTWIPNDAVLHRVYEGEAEDISEEEAARIAPMFGGTIEPSHGSQ
jgi:hypothetical protein